MAHRGCHAEIPPEMRQEWGSPPQPIFQPGTEMFQLPMLINRVYIRFHIHRQFLCFSGQLLRFRKSWWYLWSHGAISPVTEIEFQWVLNQSSCHVGCHPCAKNSFGTQLGPFPCLHRRFATTVSWHLRWTFATPRRKWPCLWQAKWSELLSMCIVYVYYIYIMNDIDV